MKTPDINTQYVSCPTCGEKILAIDLLAHISLLHRGGKQQKSSSSATLTSKVIHREIKQPKSDKTTKPEQKEICPDCRASVNVSRFESHKKVCPARNKPVAARKVKERQPKAKNPQQPKISTPSTSNNQWICIQTGTAHFRRKERSPKFACGLDVKPGYPTTNESIRCKRCMASGNKQKGPDMMRFAWITAFESNRRRH